MTQPELLKSCWSYFNQAQLSWDKYFSKWEVMAQEENVDDLDKDYLSSVEIKHKVRKKKKSIKQKRRLKLVARPGRKNSTGKEEPDRKRRKVHYKTGNQERGNEIIHKTENQTNLECEVVNNKHFEADLKAIFIEILSENTNKVGMFSVLSRMFPGSGNTISNISLSSVIMERNEFSINPVNNIILHSSSYNEFLLRGTPICGLARVLSERNSSARFHSLTQIANECEVHLCGRDNLSHLNDSYVKNPGRLFYKENPSGKMKHNGRDPGQVSKLIQTLKNESPKYLEGRSTISSTTCDCGPMYMNVQQSKDTAEYTNQLSKDNKLRCLTSPEATLRKILSPERIQSEPLRSYHRKRKRNKVNSIPYDSDDDSGDEKNNSNADGSQGRLLKIFCTPKRPKRCINSGKKDCAAIIEDSNDEDCFDIVDRVKNTKALTA